MIRNMTKDTNNMIKSALKDYERCVMHKDFDNAESQIRLINLLLQNDLYYEKNIAK